MFFTCTMVLFVLFCFNVISVGASVKERFAAYVAGVEDSGVVEPDGVVILDDGAVTVMLAFIALASNHTWFVPAPIIVAVQASAAELKEVIVHHTKQPELNAYGDIVKVSPLALPEQLPVRLVAATE